MTIAAEGALKNVPLRAPLYDQVRVPLSTVDASETLHFLGLRKEERLVSQADQHSDSPIPRSAWT